MKIAEVDLLKESTYQTPCGTIHYWSSILSLDTTTLVFLPGLTADLDCLINRLRTSMENIILLYGMHRLMPLPGRSGLILTCLIRQNG